MLRDCHADNLKILLNTVWIQADFSALFKCMGQDGLTCEQPRQAVQEVIEHPNQYINKI